MQNSISLEKPVKMPSALTYSALQITQKINNIRLFSCPVNWCANAKNWMVDSGENGFKLKKYFGVSLLWKVLFNMFSLGALVLMRSFPDNFPVEQIFLPITLAQVGLISISTDFLLVMYGSEIFACCNWIFETETLWLRYCIKKLFIFRRRDHCYSKRYNLNAKHDVAGGIVLSFTLAVTVVPVLTTVFMVVLNWDPFYVYWNALCLTHVVTDKLKKRIFEYVSKLLRCFVLLGLLQTSCVSIRVVAVASVSTASSFINLEGILRSLTCSHTTLALYKQLLVERNILRPYEIVAVSAVIVFSHFALVISINSIGIGIYIMNPMVIIAGTSTSFLSMATLVVLLRLCCGICENSKKILMQWKEDSGKRLDRRISQRVVKGCKPLFIPAGDMGKMDRDMEITFFSSVLLNTINLLLTMNSYIRN